jgi:hypothetical protein
MLAEILLKPSEHHYAGRDFTRTISAPPCWQRFYQNHLSTTMLAEILPEPSEHHYTGRDFTKNHQAN